MKQALNQYINLNYLNRSGRIFNKNLNEHISEQEDSLYFIISVENVPKNPPIK